MGKREPKLARPVDRPEMLSDDDQSNLARDTTERKRADEVLRREARILENVHDSVISTNLQGIILTWNLGAERIFGYHASEAIGSHVSFLRFADEQPGHRAQVMEPTIRLGSHELTVRCRRKDNVAISVALRLSLLRDEHGAPMGVIGCSNDISDRLHTEEALRKQREDLQTILDSVPAFIWYKDGENRILRANRAAAAAMGTTVEALDGQSVYDLHPDEAAKYHVDDLEVMRTGQPKLGIIERLDIGSGEKRWVRTDKIPNRDEAGNIIGVIVFSVDITERITAEEGLRRAHDQLEVRVNERTTQLATAVEQLRSEIEERQRAEDRARQHQATLAHLLRLRTVEGMTAELAHEINQPLAAIANFANALSQRARGGKIDVDTVEQAASHISRQALRAGEVLRRLRGFVRKDEGIRERCDLDRVIRDAVQLVEIDARRLEVALRINLAPNLPLVEIDPIQIEQVILNLLSNGLESIAAAPPRAHEIAVEVGVREELVEIRVRDTGRGLSPEEARRAFEPFFTSKSTGLGMGLSISRSIVEAHRGTLWAEPTATMGAVFAFTLPLAGEREDPAVNDPGNGAQGGS